MYVRRVGGLWKYLFYQPQQAVDSAKTLSDSLAHNIVAPDTLDRFLCNQREYDMTQAV